MSNLSPIDAGLGLITSFGVNAMNNKQAQQRERIARQENFRYGEMQADNADKRARALYQDLMSPEALRKQYEEAGLSPSLMFGGSGAGGATVPNGAQGANASVAPTTYGVNPMEAAQIGLTMAQTEKIKAETKQIEPTALADIAQKLAAAGHEKAAAAAAEAQAAGTKLDNYVKEHTLDASIYQICELAEEAASKAIKMYHEARNAKVLADLNEELYNTNLEKGKKELEQLAESITNMKANTKLTEEQRKSVKVEMLNAIEQIQIEWKKLDLETQRTTSYADYIEAQLPYIEKQLEIKLKELGVMQWKLVVDGVTNTIKAIAIGAGAAAALKGGGNAIPTYQSTTATPGLTIM